MFAKLLKHEFRKSRSILTILTVVTLAAALVATLSLKFMVVNSVPDSEFSRIMLTAVIPLMTLAFFAIFGYAIAGWILLLAQFYKSNFTDEGYLTFTLPATSHQIYLANVLNIVIWQVIMAVTIAASVAMIVFFGTSPDHFFNSDIVKFFQDEEWTFFIGQLQQISQWTPLNTVAILFQSLFSGLSSVILATTCITVGSTVAKKHKVLAAVGIYFGVGYLLSAISSTISSAVTSSSVSHSVINGTANLEAINQALQNSINVSLILGIVTSVATIVGGYFITTHLMEKKLNLP